MEPTPQIHCGLALFANKGKVGIFPYTFSFILLFFFIPNYKMNKRNEWKCKHNMRLKRKEETRKLFGEIEEG